ncbi:hypothetical protein A8B78_11770 [Jannaschia sp. EhC01]|nr:hypothetical protein A8B78_11770 [Jannaschia sp. EhC01]
MKLRLVFTLALMLAGPALAQDSADGERLFVQHCAVCHGLSLRGDGPMAPILLLPPPDLRQIAQRFGGTFPRIGTAWMIDGRDIIMSHGGDMPIYGHIFEGQSEILRSQGGQTLLTSPQVLDLVTYLESVQE